MREIADLEALQALLGTEVAVSGWIEMSQQRVDTFAAATLDHQWIHVDVERCKRESPFGGPVAHGFLTLSLLPAMFENALRMADVKMALNYGLNKVRFPAPVPVGSRLRAPDAGQARRHRGRRATGVVGGGGMRGQRAAGVRGRIRHAALSMTAIAAQLAHRHPRASRDPC